MGPILKNHNLNLAIAEEGKEYEFRVFAENEIGESEPLTTARPILAKNQYCKYQRHAGGKTEDNHRSFSFFLESDKISHG